MQANKATVSDTSSFDVEFHSEQVVSQGFTIIPNAVSPDQAREAIDALEEIYERERPIAERMGEQTENQKVARNPIAKHPFFETFYLCPPVLNVCKRILGDDMVLYDTTGRSIRPSGGREQRHGFQVHVDRELFSVSPFVDGTHIPVAINVLWPLVDFTAKNGATVIWPGSHRSLKVPESEGQHPGYVQAETPAGSVIMWDAATWHATGLNTSDHVRHSAIGFFQRRWVKGMIDNERIIPPHVKRRLSPDMRELLAIDGSLPDYSSVRGLSKEQLDRLSPWEREVIGIGIY